MDRECSYSFRDLYSAAYGMGPTELELERLYALPQKTKNEVVKEWADKAGWKVDEKMGSDGVIYLAFAPKLERTDGCG